MASSLQHLAASITERSKTLINNDLKRILKEEGLSQTGNKAALQARVISRTSTAAAAADRLSIAPGMLTFTFTSYQHRRK